MYYIIVTGDSGSLGSKIAEKILSNTKFGVIGLSRSWKDKEVEKGKYLKFYADLSHPESIKDLFLNKFRKNNLKIYGLINNSAYAYDDLITNANIKKLSKMYYINVLSPMILIKYAIRDMLLNSTKGSIVNISSISTGTGYKGLSMYASTKGALESLANNVAREWGVKGIRCNTVAPGFMKTKMTKDIDEKDQKKIFKRNCLRKEIEIDSVAETVVFLVSEKSSSITGQTIRVDNGVI